MPAPKKSYSMAESGAFVEELRLEATGSGPLDGLTFAAKDLIDIEGQVTGCGNPGWRDNYPPAAAHVVCLDHLLAAVHVVGGQWLCLCGGRRG